MNGPFSAQKEPMEKKRMSTEVEEQEDYIKNYDCTLLSIEAFEDQKDIDNDIEFHRLY